MDGNFTFQSESIQQNLSQKHEHVPPAVTDIWKEAITICIYVCILYIYIYPSWLYPMLKVDNYFPTHWPKTAKPSCSGAAGSGGGAWRNQAPNPSYRSSLAPISTNSPPALVSPAQALGLETNQWVFLVVKKKSPLAKIKACVTHFCQKGDLFLDGDVIYVNLFKGFEKVTNPTRKGIKFGHVAWITFEMSKVAETHTVAIMCPWYPMIPSGIFNINGKSTMNEDGFLEKKRWEFPGHLRKTGGFHFCCWLHDLIQLTHILRFPDGAEAATVSGTGGSWLGKHGWMTYQYTRWTKGKTKNTPEN